MTPSSATQGLPPADGERTLLLALVETEAEAEMARAAGADLTAAGPALGELGIVKLGTEAAGSLEALKDLCASGSTAALLDTGPERLFEALSFADLERFAADCRATGLRCGFAGALEAPDVPRLLPLRPAFLGFDAALRTGAGELDIEAVDALARLLRPSLAQPHSSARPDRVFIRDFVQEMEIGAYGSERGRRQRVRFSVEAEIAPGGRPRGIADVYSYDRMMDAVRALAARPHEAFVETLAEMLAEDLLADPRLSAVTVRVEKLDLGPASAGIEIRRQRR